MLEITGNVAAVTGLDFRTASETNTKII